MMRQIVIYSLIVFCGLPCRSAFSADTTGELIFDLKPFTSEIKIKENVLKRLRLGQITWGMVDNELVVTLVNPVFVGPTLGQVTRYAEQTSLKLKPGAYKLTCIGFWLNSVSNDTAVVLSKSAFFNLGVASFNIEEGKTTRIEIDPVIQKQKQHGFWVNKWMYSPNLLVKLFEHGEVKYQGDISSASDKSIAWDDYSGPLKRRVATDTVRAPTGNSPAAAQERGATPQSDQLAGRLSQLKDLFDRGLITEKEYNEKRKEILGSL